MLPAAADWLIDAYGREMAHVTVVVPVRRAIRNLEQHLLERESVLARPRIITPAGLADLPIDLSPADGAGLTVASELDAGLAWVSVLQDFARGDGERLAALVPDPPAPSDFAGWWSLANRLAGLRQQLAAGRKTLADAASAAGGSGVRWAVLGSLEQAYLATLAQRDKVDRDVAREQRLATVEIDTPLILLATADLTPLQQAVVARGDDVTALVFAGADVADGFDHDGALVSSFWEERVFDDSATRLRMVDRRGDQPAAATSAIASSAASRAESDVTVALGDEALGPAVVRAIETAGGTARTAVGRPLNESGPCALWAALADFVENVRFDALAALLRHPDVEVYLDRERASADAEVEEHLSDAVGAWQTLLDDYLSKTLQAELVDGWLGGGNQVDALKWVHDRVRAILPVKPDDVRALSQWTGPLKAALSTVYAQRTFDPDDRADAEAIQALSMLTGLLDEQGLLAASREDVPDMTAAQAMRWTLARLGSPPATDPPTAGGIEVMGMLDAVLDDAPVMVVTSFNDGHLPGRVPDVAGGLLPGSMRRRLGLPDDRRRLVRDAYLLHALNHSREDLTLVSARRGDEGEPLKPSRLWLLGGDAQLTARRLQRFYGADDAPGTPGWLQPGATNHFIIPRPVGVPRVARLSVTALRDYLACPYRFYLKHVLQLKQIDDRAVEMDALAFGNLVHDVLAGYGLDDDAPRESGDRSEVAAFLSSKLDAVLTEKFGPTPRVAVRVQAEFARERLEAFSDIQATWNQQGWRVAHAEHPLQHTYERPGGSLTLRGRIDRIDAHPDLGWRVLDFKTGDTAKSPDDTHLGKDADGNPAWTDLQLPVYRDLISAAEIASDGRPTEYGYVVLPRKLDEVAPSPADWDDAVWASAAKERDRVLDGILAHDFKPSPDVPRFDDGLAGVCADAWTERANDLARWEHADA